MKYRFEKVTRELTPEEKRKRSRIVFGIIAAVIVILLILFGMRWYKIHSFKQRVGELKVLVEAGDLMKACEFIRYRDREAARAGARWAEVTDNSMIVSDMKLLHAKHSPNWSLWQTDLKFTLNVGTGYDKYFVRTVWIREEGEWVIDFQETYEYMPIDNTTRGKMLDLIESLTTLDLDEYLQSESPPSE
ncbi:hypothetical protein J7K50_03880 [bacterium]|nr:hypothetical protein [bacterium]